MCMEWELWFEALEQRRQKSQAKTPPATLPSRKAEPQPAAEPEVPVPLDAEPEPV